MFDAEGEIGQSAFEVGLQIVSVIPMSATGLN